MRGFLMVILYILFKLPWELFRKKKPKREKKKRSS